MPDFSIERNFFDKGCSIIAGIDEAGRGALAGPLFVGITVFPAEIFLRNNSLLSLINDSKQLSPKKRLAAIPVITDTALYSGYALISSEEIDRLGLTAATRICIENCVKMCGLSVDMLLLDGKCSFGISYPHSCHVNGDALSISVAAASLIAKVNRDSNMLESAEEYPQYLFEKHKGYGTALHLEKLRKHGPCSIHRKSYAPVKDCRAY